jgi:polyhydroxyalkanoate synthase
MAGAFRMLNSNDLVWSRVIRDYLMGERRPMTDLTAWNADATRMPARMHAEYLRRLFLDNDLAEGRLHAGGRPVVLSDLEAPVFAVGTETDHVAPWRSVYKLHLLLDTDLTFLLTNGGHNAGIVSEPGHKGRRYRVRTKHEHERYIDPDTWLSETAPREGSWWPEWVQWLAERSGPMVEPPRAPASGGGDASLGRAPGSYVLRR